MTMPNSITSLIQYRPPSPNIIVLDMFYCMNASLSLYISNLKVFANYSRKFYKEQLYKSARSTRRHQEQQIWGWCVISMKLESFGLSCNNKVLVFPGHWLPTWFTCTRSSLAEDLAAQSSLEEFMKLHMLWVVLWSLGFAYFSLHKFSQIFVRNALLFAVFDNTMCTTLSTTKFCSNCHFSKWRGEIVCGVQNS